MESERDRDRERESAIGRQKLRSTCFLSHFPVSRALKIFITQSIATIRCCCQTATGEGQLLCLVRDTHKLQLCCTFELIDFMNIYELVKYVKKHAQWVENATKNY